MHLLLTSNITTLETVQGPKTFLENLTSHRDFSDLILFFEKKKIAWIGELHTRKQSSNISELPHQALVTTTRSSELKMFSEPLACTIYCL